MSKLTGNVAFDGIEGKYVFFDEVCVPVGLFDTKEQAQEASEEYFSALNRSRAEDDDWLSGTPAKCTDEVCESCQ